MTVFVDTGVLFGAASRRDARHRRASELLEGLASQSPVATDHVVIESWMLLAGRFGWAHAMRFWRGIRATALHVEAVTPVDMERALAIAESWSDQSFDIVDCTSFVVMERIGCTRAASFDPDFSVYRFGPDRKRAFEVMA